jgi:hypothetical protein
MRLLSWPSFDPSSKVSALVVTPWCHTRSAEYHGVESIVDNFPVNAILPSIGNHFQREFCLNPEARFKHLFQYLSPRQNTIYTYKLLIFANLRRHIHPFFKLHGSELGVLNRVLFFCAYVTQINVNHGL